LDFDDMRERGGGLKLKTVSEVLQEH